MNVMLLKWKTFYLMDINDCFAPRAPVFKTKWFCHLRLWFELKKKGFAKRNWGTAFNIIWFKCNRSEVAAQAATLFKCTWLPCCSFTKLSKKAQVVTQKVTFMTDSVFSVLHWLTEMEKWIFLFSFVFSFLSKIIQ